MPYPYVTPVKPNSNNPSSTMAASNTQPPSISRPCSLPHHHHHRNLFFCRHHPNPCHHHHRHHFSPNCPLHSYLFHPKLCPTFTVPPPPPLPPQNPEPAASIRSTNNSNTQMMQEENEELEEEYEDEPVFVLTDEWREFFAKSEAKRRLARKEAKKKGKH